MCHTVIKKRHILKENQMKKIVLVLFFSATIAPAQMTVKSSDGNTVLMKVLENGNVGIGTTGDRT